MGVSRVWQALRLLDKPNRAIKVAFWSAFDPQPKSNANALISTTTLCLLYKPSNDVFQRVLQDTCAYWLVRDHQTDTVFEKLHEYAEMQLLGENKMKIYLHF